MIERVKIVYYCEFCKRHRLTKNSIKDHEIHCTLNPNRVCGWHKWQCNNMLSQVAALNTWDELNEKSIGWLSYLMGNCPACMLSCLRLSKFAKDHSIFDYEKQIEEYRKQERS